MPLNEQPINPQPKKKKKRREVEGRDRFTPLTIFMLVILTLYVFSMFYLLGWTLITAVKHNSDFRSNILGLHRPTSPNGKMVWGWQWRNFIEVFDYFFVRTVVKGQMVTFGLDKMFLYAFIYSVGCAFCNSLVPMLTAYMCARFNFFFSKIIHTIVVVAMILPIIGALPSEIRMAKFFGLYDQLWGLWIMRANFLGMYFLVFYGNFKALPMAYTEAAKIDGAGNLDILIRIIIPLVKNTFFTIFLLHFISYWNDYNTPLIYMPSYPTIAYGLYVVTTTTQNEMSHTTRRMAAAILMLFPILILFLSFHKRLLGNLTVGGLKG
jgi:ABC-type glycerol-3-phosphate transport system permease component